MGFVDNSDVMNFEYWFEPEFVGEQWGIGVHDLDGNGYLDFYANHHGQQTGEIIMNFASGDPTNIFFEIPGDLHGVTFFDIDQDGDADLLQGQGGRRGAATDPNDPSLFNKVLLNTGGTLSLTNSAGDFGIGYPLGRKRLLTPVNFDGDLAIYVGVLDDRPDDSYPGDFFERRASGTYREVSPFGDEIKGDIAKGVHFGTDRFVDIVNLDWKARALRVVENTGSGFGDVVTLNTLGAQLTDVVTGDFDGDLKPEILVGRAGRSEGLFRQDGAGRWIDVSASTTTPFVKSSHVLTAGDFDNDGDLDYVALKRQDGVEVQTYLNRGDGKFTVGPRFFDPAITGRGDFMISGDFNRDGALDLLITTSASIDGGQGSRPGVYVLLEGEPNENNWLSIELRGRASETGGLGARVFVTTADGEVRVLEQDSGAHFTSQNSTDLHFGLGDNRTADVQIVWPDGVAQTMTAVRANQHVVLTERRADGFASLITGSDRDDSLRGTAAADLIRAGSGDDRLSGGRGDDALYGGKDDDRLFGGKGDDTLLGGLGGDEMTGGPGDDVFVFSAVKESVPGRLRDVILDFDAAVDTLDLSRIDANAVRSGEQAFDFIRRADFGRSAGELRFEKGDVQGDVDGDGRRDFVIELADVASLGAGALLL